MDDRAKQAKKQFKRDEVKRLEESMPIDVDTLKELLSFLYREAAPPCDHTLKETVEWISSRGIAPDNVVPWLKEHGGYCDCEVVFNVYDAYGSVVGWHLNE